ncbi:DNA excision repair protein ERCC-6-like 2 isoform X2 [Pecten maximus]|uniref:DNA excision repair protein ERCC-6-like 2 isoform X2 n=1 Tax=Pecten maximus TaxID=6579 RepID=UPI001458EF92|nr:DNA excision repair protein ERCC-6-like 2 isoform X2 [Pecten maximus]
MFGPSEEGRGKVWSVGELCRAPYSDDAEYYKARIEKLTHKHGSVIATISFVGYSLDDTEDVDINSLQKISRKKATPDVSIIEPAGHNDSLFQPLDGKEQVSWLSDKYANIDEEEEEDHHVLKKKVKGVVVTGGASKNRLDIRQRKRGKAELTSERSGEKLGRSPQKRDRPCGNVTGEHASESGSVGSLKSPQTGSSLARVSASKWRRLDTELQIDDDEEEEEIRETTGCEGFDEEELEKPRFKFTQAAAKLPFQLSAGSPDKHPIQVPATINQYLRDYQRDGIKFMYSHYRKDRGAILGDDMGLGKTVQVIGLLSALLHKKGNKIDVQKQKPKFIRQMSDAVSLSDTGVPQHGPFLIIGPGSVLYNWLDELEVWGYFTVGKYHATEKVRCLSDVQRGKYEVVVTTYETFRDNRKELNDIQWDAVFVDEVHRIKGLTAQVTKSLRKLKCMRRFGLTGTALQNSMIELWSILDWAQPGCLGLLSDFKEDYVDPIEKGQKKTVTKRELAFARKKNQEFGERRGKMLLRRTKDLISEQLPNKDDNIVFCKLTDFQTSVYQAVLTHPGMRFVLNMDEPCDCGSDVIKGRCHNKTPDGVSTRQMRFTFMHILLKIANHVALLVRSEKSDKQLTEFSKEVIKYIQEKFPEFFSETREAAFRTLSDPKYCGKMKILKGLLSVFSRDHSKVLLFSYSTKVLDILEQYMMTTGYEYRRLDGSTSVKKRMELVREFNKDPSIFIFLISTKAGGLGLNLTGANRVVIFDPNWNPTHDLQAQDRAYRIGQRRNVQVYRLISAGSIEENMYLRQVYKQQLDSVAVGTMNAKRYFNAISGDSDQKGELFGVKNMFKLHSGDRCLTMDILQRNTNLEMGLAGYDLAKYIPPVESPKQNEDDSGEDVSIVSDDESDNDMMEGESPAEAEPGTLNEEGRHSSTERTRKEKKTSKVQEVKSIKPKSTKRMKINPDSSGQFDSVDGDHGQIPSSNLSFSSVGAVFEKCGVLHVHQNKKVIGASKAEDHMTRCAIQDVYEFNQNSQAPAAYCAPYSDSSSEGETPPPKSKGRGKKKSAGSSNIDRSRVEVIGNSKVLIGQTPRGIRQRQFQQMAGQESLVNFAQTVLLADRSTRTKMLEDFYVKANPDLSRIFRESPQQQQASPSNDSLYRSRSSKPPRKMKDNPTLGVSYMSDSESLGAKTITRTSSRDSDPSDSLEIGRKVKKRKGNASMTTRTRRPSKRTTGNSSHSSGAKIHGLAMSPVWSVQDSDKEEDEGLRTCQSGPLSTELLEEIGVDTKKDTVSGKTDECTLDVSVYEDIDSIFLCDRKSSKSVRKPAPGRGREREGAEGKGRDRNVPPGDTTDRDTSVVVSESNIELLNDSTLKDDSFDCFSDPLKWKKKKKALPQAGVDKLISDGDADFLSLFAKGKMRKKDKVLPVVEIKDDSKSLAEQTPSLF